MQLFLIEVTLKIIPKVCIIYMIYIIIYVISTKSPARKVLQWLNSEDYERRLTKIANATVTISHHLDTDTFNLKKNKIQSSKDRANRDLQFAKVASKEGVWRNRAKFSATSSNPGVGIKASKPWAKSSAQHHTQQQALQRERTLAE